MRFLLGLPANLCITMALVSAQPAVDSSLSFFITSAGPGKGANLGGIDGADAHCLKLATAVGAGKRTWHAYLSTQAAENRLAVNARDRIGAGPWFNAKKVRVALSVADLHSANNNLGKQTSLTEKGDTVKGRGDTPNQHDILTGSDLDGTAFGTGADSTCANWTSETTGGAQVGHFDKQGGGANPTSWNSAHRSNGCSPANLAGSGGAGYFYCFAADAGGATGIRENPLRQLGMGRVALMNAGGGLVGSPGNRGGNQVFRFELPEELEIEVQVADLRGQKLATLYKGRKPSGAHKLRWDGRDAGGNALPAGLYLVRLLTPQGY